MEENESHQTCFSVKIFAHRKNGSNRPQATKQSINLNFKSAPKSFPILKIKKLTLY